MSGGLFRLESLRSTVVSLLSAECRIFVFFDSLWQLSGHDFRKCVQFDLAFVLRRHVLVSFRIEAFAVSQAEALDILWQLPGRGLTFFDDPEAFQRLVVHPVLDLDEELVVLGVLAFPGWAV